jgi:hypothetical protein
METLPSLQVLILDNNPELFSPILIRFTWTLFCQSPSSPLRLMEITTTSGAKSGADEMAFPPG